MYSPVESMLPQTYMGNIVCSVHLLFLLCINKTHFREQVHVEAFSHYVLTIVLKTYYNMMPHCTLISKIAYII